MSGILKEINPLKAAFSFESYTFPQCELNFAALSDSENIEIDFRPSGLYDPNTGRFTLNLHFLAYSNSKHILDIHCQASFIFAEALTQEELPEYFFTNATAIIYPYIRAFVSTLTLQANYNAFVLPTLNVGALGKRLKGNTSIVHHSQNV